MLIFFLNKDKKKQILKNKRLFCIDNFFLQAKPFMFGMELVYMYGLRAELNVLWSNNEYFCIL